MPGLSSFLGVFLLCSHQMRSAAPRSMDSPVYNPMMALNGSTSPSSSDPRRPAKLRETLSEEEETMALQIPHQHGFTRRESLEEDEGMGYRERGRDVLPEFLYPIRTSDPDTSDRRKRPPDLSTTFSVTDVPLMRLTKDILAPGRYDVRVRPIIDHSRPLKVHISMSLYQIIDVNEPAQNIKMNVWMIQKWHDEMLHWDPREYDLINSTILPHEVLWIPDTYVYNSVVMNAEETERYMNIRAESLFWEGRQGSNMSFLYPAIYTVTCRLNIRYFPYDQQNCTLTISSWTNSKSALDYYADEQVNLASFIPNEEWDVTTFRIFRHEYKYACCPEPWVILEASIVLRRKPLYYVINLIIPTSIITLVAITGFFTPASTADDRTEKINLGITTLLAMSILMLMVSDQMPTTSEFVPLIAWFYLSIIIIISIGTFLTSVILSIQGRRQYGQLPSLRIRYIFFVKLAKWLCLSVPPPLLALWEEMNDHPLTSLKRNRKAEEDRAQERLASRRTKKPQEKRRMSRIGEEVECLTNGDGAKVAAGRAISLPMRSPRLSLPQSPLEDEVVLPVSAPAAVPKAFRSGEGVGSRRARDNWLRAGSVASGRRFSQQTEHLSPRSPMTPVPLTTLGGSRRSSVSVASVNWENAMGGLGMVMSPRPNATCKSPGRRKKSVLVGGALAEVNSMKMKRQCSLEWEFIATILDRLFLFIFTLTVVVITAGIMVTGRVAQWHYEQIARELA